MADETDTASETACPTIEVVEAEAVCESMRSMTRCANVKTVDVITEVITEKITN